MKTSQQASKACPSFLVIGAMKAATSTVCAYLEDHPEVYCVPNSEPNYFSHDEIFEKGLQWYMQFFDQAGYYKHCGEGSNLYSARSLYPRTAERIFALNPEVKIIYMVRHPIERIVSAWIQRRSDAADDVPSTVEVAIQERYDEFVGQSLYYFNIQPYVELFPRCNIFIGFMEDLRSDEEGFFRNLCEFLNIEYVCSKRRHLNPSIGKKIPGDVYLQLKRFPIVNSVKNILPNIVKKAIKQYLKKEVSSSDVYLSPAVLAFVSEALKDDSREILKFSGRPQDFWELGAPKNPLR